MPIKEKIKILLVDDEPDIIEIVSYNLAKEGYQIATASNGKEAVIKTKSYKPHLILLDIMMPKMDGLEACKRIRAIDEFKDTIIVFFTARAEDYSQEAGFDAGADDYITKPVKPKILLKKIEALTRRISFNHEVKNQVIIFDKLKIDPILYIVKHQEKIIDLPKKEFELLLLLASKEGHIFKRKTILNKVWGDVVVGDRTIDVHIRKLRKKIGNQYFKTIKGVGYKFVANDH
jgi:two-component system alkaline phosphatase synthesis response regulator PhoP